MRLLTLIAALILVPAFASAQFPTTSVVDDFNRSNEGPPPSASWTTQCTVNQSEWSELEVSSNACITDGTSGVNASSCYNTSYGPDSEVYVTAPTDPESYERMRLYVRVTGRDPDNAYYLQLDKGTGGGNNSVQLWKLVSDVGTQLGSTITSVSFANGDKLGLEANGTTIEAYSDVGGGWSSLGSRTDSSISGAGLIGIGTSGTDTVMDDFGGGTISAGPSGPPAGSLLLMGVGK